MGPPSTADSFPVDASRKVYLSFAKGGVVAIDGDASTSTEWDLSLSQTVVETNSGTSAAGLGGSRVAPMGMTYEDVGESPTHGFAVDAMFPAPGPPGAGEVSASPDMYLWYEYDQMAHKVTTKGETYLVRTAGGDYGKLQILYYDADALYELRMEPIGRTVTTETVTIDAGDGNAWAHFSLRRGELVAFEEDETPAESMLWDIALSESRVQTNGGTSGPGSAGAMDPMESSLAAISDAPAMGYVIDEMLSIDGNDFSGNAVLNTWYETGTTNPRDAAFMFLSPDGGFVKMKVTDYAAGVYTIDYAYSGPGRSDF